MEMIDAVVIRRERVGRADGEGGGCEGDCVGAGAGCGEGSGEGQAVGGGALRVTVAANRNPSIPTNSLHQIQFARERIQAFHEIFERRRVQFFKRRQARRASSTTHRS